MRHRCIAGVGAVLLFAIPCSPSASYAGDTSTKTVPTEIELPSRGDTLTLRDALSLALLKNPELASVSWERRAAEANAIQQGLFPNPELEFEVENVGGRGSAGAFEASETTILLSQMIETGGKRGKRRKVAGLGAELVGWDYESKQLDILSGKRTILADVRIEVLAV